MLFYQLPAENYPDSAVLPSALRYSVAIKSFKLIHSGA
jgi:hypothetical protein